METMFRKAALEWLKANNRKDLERLEREGKLEEYLNDLQEIHQGEAETMRIQMTQNLPTEYMKRVAALKEAHNTAVNTAMANMYEFLQTTLDE